MAKGPQVLQVYPQDFSQKSPSDVGYVLMSWSHWLASGDIPHFRVISRAVPMDMSVPVARAREAEARAEDEASAQIVRQYRGLLERTAKHELYGNEHYMIFWASPMETQGIKRNMEQMGFNARVRTGLPPIVSGRYRDAWSCLEPIGSSQAARAPFLAVLTSYDFIGAWEWTALASLLYQGFPITVAVDVETMGKAKARRSLNMSQNALMASLEELGRDVEVTERWTALERATQAIHAGQTLHLNAVAILVPGKTMDELNERVEGIQASMGRYMSLTKHRPQSQMFRSFFTAGERGPADKTVGGRLRRNTLSEGTAVALGILGASRRGDTDGTLWGFGDDGSPIFWDGFGPDLDWANHGIILGMTGTGKTFSTHMILLREVQLHGTQVIELEPMGHGRLLAQAVGERASHNVLSFETMTVNPLDIVHADPQDQHAHVMTQVALLLNRPLNNFEQAAVDLACQEIYAGVTLDDPLSVHPRLENLVRALRLQKHSESGVELARELGGLYIEGGLSKVFNVPTNLDLRLVGDVVIFDFHKIPERFQRLLYGLVLTALQRECLRRRRERRRIIFVDEFKRMSEEPLLAQTVANMFKTFRTAGTAVWVAEQNLFTLQGLDESGGNEGLDVVSGRYVVENSTFQIFLGQQESGVAKILQTFSDVTENHARLLLSARQMGDKGHGVVRLPDGVYPIRFIPTTAELQLLGGS